MGATCTHLFDHRSRLIGLGSRKGSGLASTHRGRVAAAAGGWAALEYLRNNGSDRIDRELTIQTVNRNAPSMLTSCVPGLIALLFNSSRVLLDD